MTKLTTHYASTCQYIGAEAHTHTPTCTHSTVEGRSYCGVHLAVVYKLGTARAKRHKELSTADKVRIVESLMNEAIEQLEAEGFDCYGTSELNTELEFGEEVVVEA